MTKQKIQENLRIIAFIYLAIFSFGWAFIAAKIFYNLSPKELFKIIKGGSENDRLTTS